MAGIAAEDPRTFDGAEGRRKETGVMDRGCRRRGASEAAQRG